MLLHILKLIKTQRRSNTWVFIELLVVFVLLWYAVDRMTMSRITQAQPMGYSFEDVYKVTLAVRPSTSASYITYAHLGRAETFHCHRLTEQDTFLNSGSQFVRRTTIGRMYIEDTEVIGRNTEVESIPVNRIFLLKISIRIGHIGIRHRSLVRQANHLHVGMRLQLADDTHEILSRPLASLFVGNIGSAAQ